MSIALPPLFGAVNTATALITAFPDIVWPILFDRPSWIDDFIVKVPIDGPENTVGERARFTSRTPDGAEAARLEEILVSQPPRRLVTRLVLEESDTTFAFAEWRLTPEGGGTLLEMNLYWTDVPEASADWTAIQARRQSYVDHTQAVLETLVAGIARAAMAPRAVR